MTTALSVTSTSTIEVSVSAGLQKRSTIASVATKPEFGFIELDTVVGKELVHGDITHRAIFEHFWLIESKDILEENILQRKRRRAEESRSPGGQRREEARR